MYSSKKNHIPASWSSLDEETTSDQGSGAAATTIDENTNGEGTTGAGAVVEGWTNSHLGAHPTLPASFLRSKAVRTVYGLVPLAHALDWPVFASYDELACCASWMGGRIPTVEEAQSIYAYVDGLKKEASTKSRLANKVPAVNG